MIPKKTRIKGSGEVDDEQEDTEEAFEPAAWTRSHYLVNNAVIIPIMLYIIEFSYTTYWGSNIFGLLIATHGLFNIIEITSNNFMQEELVVKVCWHFEKISVQ